MFFAFALAVICRNRQNHRLLIPKMSLARHSYRCVGYSICNFCQGIAGTRRYNHYIKKRFRTYWLCINNAVYNFVSRNPSSLSLKSSALPNLVSNLLTEPTVWGKPLHRCLQAFQSRVLLCLWCRRNR